MTRKLLVVEVPEGIEHISQQADGQGDKRHWIRCENGYLLPVYELPTAEELGRMALMADPDAMLNGDDTDRFCLVGQAIIDEMPLKILTEEQVKRKGFFTQKELLLMREALRDTTTWPFKKRQMATKIIATLDIVLARLKS